MTKEFIKCPYCSSEIHVDTECTTNQGHMYHSNNDTRLFNSHLINNHINDMFTNGCSDE